MTFLLAYLLIGVGVYAGLTALRWSEIKSAAPLAIVLGVVFTILFWPYALYNNLK